MDMPESGGRWVRDPDTGTLTRVPEPTPPAADPIAGEAIVEPEPAKPPKTRDR